MASFFDHGGQSTNKSCSPEYPKFLVLHANDNSKLSTVSPFLVSKSILGIAGSVKHIKKLPSGDLLIETATPAQSRNLLKTNMLAHIPVTVSPHASLNSSKGVIYCPDLMDIGDNEILEELGPQGLTAIFRIKTKRDEKVVPTPLFILTFAKSTLPNDIMIGYLRVKIRPYIPNPLRCFRCQRFGHGTAACRGAPTCNKCGSGEHASESCTAKQKKCVNCKGDHAAYSKTCTEWIKEKEIQRIKVLDNISFAEARRRVVNMLPPQPSTSYADIVKTKTASIATQYEPQSEEPPTTTPELENNSRTPQNYNDKTIDSQLTETPTIKVTPSDPPVTSDAEDSMDVETKSRAVKRLATEAINREATKFQKSYTQSELSPAEKLQFEIFTKNKEKTIEIKKTGKDKNKHPPITFGPENIPGSKSPKGKK